MQPPEPRRRDDLIRAAIAEVAEAGAGPVTVGRIAARAGMSSALAHHYFGSKDRMLLAAMRHILARFGADVARALAAACSPAERLDAIVAASFAPANFDDATIAAWLTFYMRAQGDPAAARLLRVYHRRLRSNLVHALRPLTPEPDALAESVAALIDGLYLRRALRPGGPDAAGIVRAHIARALA